MQADPRPKVLLMVAVVLAALAVPAALLSYGGWRMWQERRASQAAESAHNEALRAALERAANVVMPVPQLTEAVVFIECPINRFEEELQRVVRLARGVGGSASSWNDGQQVRIVVNVPSSAADIFRDSVTRGVLSISAAGDKSAMEVVQVVLRPAPEAKADKPDKPAKAAKKKP